MPYGSKHLCWYFPGLTSVLLAATVSSAWPQGAQVAGTFKDWALHVHTSEAGKLCFVASQPKEKSDLANRAAAAAYISAWPKEVNRSEVSIKLGFPIKPKSNVAVTIGDQDFKLVPREEERGYAADLAQEKKLIASMRKGETMIVKAMPDKGALASDTYSLAGITQALEAMAQECK